MIENCWVSAKPPSEKAYLNPIRSILISNVANKTAKIRNNICVNTYSGIYVHQSSFASVENNIIALSSSGVKINNSHFVEVKNNLVYDNKSGLIIHYSDNVSITGNDIYLSERLGITTYSANYAFIYKNKIVENGDYGIRITNCVYAEIHHNDFIDNGLTPQANDGGTDTMWHCTDTLEGNYWSDYSEEGAYKIDRIFDMYAGDPYPLSEPCTLSKTKMNTSVLLTLIGLLIVMDLVSVGLLLVKR